MAKHVRALGIVAIVLALTAGPVLAEHHEEEAAPSEMDAWVALGKPGEHHGHLAMLAGTWKVEGQMWMAPGQDPVPLEGLMKNTMIMDGRYLETRYTSTFMGEPFEGRGIDAYDNGEGMYVATWIDTMSTMIGTYHGTCENDGKVRTMHHELKHPTGEVSKGKTVTTVIDKNTYKMEAWRSVDGGEFVKEMEFTAKRR